MEQLLNDTMRVVGVLEVFYVVCLVCMALKWLMNLIWKGVAKASRAVGDLLKKSFHRPEVAVTAEQNVEV